MRVNVTLLTANLNVGRGWQIADTIDNIDLDEAERQIDHWMLRHGHAAEVRDLDGNLLDV